MNERKAIPKKKTKLSILCNNNITSSNNNISPFTFSTNSRNTSLYSPSSAIESFHTTMLLHSADNPAHKCPQAQSDHNHAPQTPNNDNPPRNSHMIPYSQPH